MRSAILSLLLLWLFGLVQALSSSGSRLLVLTDAASEDKSKYSKFWSDLESRGFDITFSSAKSDPPLFKHGQKTQDHLFILPTKLKGLGPSLTPQILLDFAREEGNIFFALSANVPTPLSIQSLLLELDISLPSDRSSLVVDHFNYDSISASEAHDVLLVPPHSPRRKDVKDYFGGYDGLIAVPRAVGQALGNESPLLSSILSAPNTAYSHSPKDGTDSVEEPSDFAIGSQINLVSAMQARNSARFTVLGSAEALEDTWFDADVRPSSDDKAKKGKTANRIFAEKLSAWTFKELGVLRASNLHHYLSAGEQAVGGFGKNETEKGLSEAGTVLNPKNYRIKNEATYSIDLSEYSMTHWTPYTPPPSDAIQLEFTMLSPYHRLPLSPAAPSSKNSTTYKTTFRLPDQHGIFNFRLNYKRPFLTSVDEKRAVTVRHYAHDEWPRSFVIPGAYVWILGIGVTVWGWVAFVGVWLYAAPQRDGVKKTQ